MAMKPPIGRRLAVLAASTVAVGATLATALPSASAAPAAPRPAAATPGSVYLALGDSVPFGFREQANLPTPDYSKPNSFVGYPEMVARALKLKLTNAACPGETSASLVSATQQSNGCETQPDGSPGYRAAFPLKASYKGSQLSFAINFLKSHRNTRLVTLMVGANDGFLCQESTADHCTSPSELAAVLNTIQKNVTTIMTGIRQKAGYTGQLVVVNYYSLDYHRALFNHQSQAVNAVVDGVAQKFGARVTSSYKMFRIAAEQAGGHTCAAGLLTALQNAPKPCGVHPSLSGHAVLARSVEERVRQ